jgi:hypothetical protein
MDIGAGGADGVGGVGGVGRTGSARTGGRGTERATAPSASAFPHEQASVPMAL